MLSMHNQPQLFFSPDGGGGTSSPPDAGNTADPAGNEGDPAEAGDAPIEGDNGNNPPGKTFTQAELDLIVKQRLEREQKKAEKAAEKARKDAELSALAEQQEWQQLATKRQEAIVELESQVGNVETLTSLNSKYETALMTYRDALMDGVPASVTTLLEGKDVADQLAWLSEHRSEFVEQQGRLPGMPATPKPSDGQTMTVQERRKRAYMPRM